MTLLQRRIGVQFQIGVGAFGESGTNTVTLDAHRVHVDIADANGPAMGTAKVRIYGLTPSLMNQLGSLNQRDALARKCKIVITAGDAVSGMATVFVGQVVLSQIDLSTSPEVALNVMAFGGQLGAVQSANPLSYPGSADAGVIMQNIGAAMGLGGFENSGVSAQISTPYYRGSLKDQADACAAAGRFCWKADQSANVLAIWWPKIGRTKLAVPLISPETGLVGYPGYQTTQEGGGLALTTIFNPQIRVAGYVQVAGSSLAVANGRWQVFGVNHELESEVPGGSWFTHFQGVAFS